jgi:hypothetical protein
LTLLNLRSLRFAHGVHSGRACRIVLAADIPHAVDAEGEVLDVLVQARRNKRAALKLMRKLLKKYGFTRH